MALGALVLMLAIAMPALAQANGMAPTYVVDPLTGVALDGLDPVSYFTDPEPQLGKPDYEYDWRNVPWYFANAANRDEFMRHPQIYAPQFDGHATMSLARGYLSDGNPQIYLLVQQRLYLFYSLANRNAFELAAGEAIDKAHKQWTTLSSPQSASAASPGQ